MSRSHSRSHGAVFRHEPPGLQSQQGGAAHRLEGSIPSPPRASVGVIRGHSVPRAVPTPYPRRALIGDEVAPSYLAQQDRRLTRASEQPPARLVRVRVRSA
jgi:hypothetical protein